MKRAKLQKPQRGVIRKARGNAPGEKRKRRFSPERAASNKWIKGKDERLAGFAWQAGYGAFSIGMSNVAALERYIARQKTHHQQHGFEDDYRTLLTTYRVERDEHFVWD